MLRMFLSYLMPFIIFGIPIALIIRSKRPGPVQGTTTEGNIPNYRADSKQFPAQAFSKTFKAPGFFVPDPLVLANEMNSWFKNNPNVSFVRMNLQIYSGLVRQITITCNMSPNPMPFLFGIDVIKFKTLEMFGMPDADRCLNEWIGRHPGADIVLQRVVTYNSVPSQIWILYKYSRKGATNADMENKA